MTQSEYKKLYSEARQQSTKIIMQVRRELKKVYTEAATLASAEVARVEAAGLSDLTSAAWRQINEQLLAGAKIIEKSVEEWTPLSISEAYQNYLDVDTQYILDAANPFITEAGIRNMGIGVDFRLLQAQASRVFQDGYTFSDRVIKVGEDYQYRIKNLILTGQAQGRDSVKIAKDIQVYVKLGKGEVFKPGRYGRLIPRTTQYKARISGTVDWRAIRLVRSEMNASLQEVGRQEGILNPGATGYYDWVKTSGNPIDPVNNNNASGKRCIDLQREGPYLEQDIPKFQHPNCSCSVRPKLMNTNDFINDLKNWTPGDGGYLDNWYYSVYLPANR